MKPTWRNTGLDSTRVRRWARDASRTRRLICEPHNDHVTLTDGALVLQLSREIAGAAVKGLPFISDCLEAGEPCGLIYGGRSQKCPAVDVLLPSLYPAHAAYPTWIYTLARLPGERDEEFGFGLIFAVDRERASFEVVDVEFCDLITDPKPTFFATEAKIQRHSLVGARFEHGLWLALTMGNAPDQGQLDAKCLAVAEVALRQQRGEVKA